MSSHVDPTSTEPSMDKNEKALLLRVVQVISQNRDSRRELQTLTRKLDGLVRDKSELEKKRDAGVAAKDKMTVLWNALQDRNKQLRDEAKDQGDQEKVRREQLSVQLNCSIGEITTRMEKDSDERTAIINENEKLKIELREHERQIEAFVQTYNSTFGVRDTESRMLQMKLTILLERQQKDEALIPSLEESYKAVSKIDSELRAQVADYAKQFDAIQKDLTESNSNFHKNRAEIERASKRFKVLEGERGEALRRLEKAQLTTHQAALEKQEVEGKIRSMEEQSKKLESLCEILKAEIAAAKK